MKRQSQNLLKSSNLLLFSIFLLFEGFVVPTKASVLPINEIIEAPAPAQPELYLKVAVVQWNPQTPAPVGANQTVIQNYLKDNLHEMALRIRQAHAKGARFIVFSELATVGYPDIPELPPEEDEFRDRADIEPFVDSVPGSATTFFSKIASELQVWIQFGLAEIDHSTNLLHNTTVVLNEKGLIAGKYRKINLFSTEKLFFSPGDTISIFKSPIGTTGLMICADIYDHKLLQKYRKQNVNAISVSASWVQWNSAISFFKSAANATNSYILASNQTYFPDSAIIDPHGKILAHIRQSGDTIAYAYIPLAP